MSDAEDAAILLVYDEIDRTNEEQNGRAMEIQGKPTNLNGQLTSMPPDPSTGMTNLLITSACMAALGGLLFGYDVGIISTALPQLKATFSLTCFQEEMTVSSMLLGALLASLIGGPFIDRFGSRITIIINAAIFTIGALILSLSFNYHFLLAGRFVIGFAVALSAVSECMYIAEISAPQNRGMLVSLNELGITLGFLVAYLVGLIYVNDSNGWRYMFGLSAVPAVIQLIGMLKLPNSPQYLVFQHKDQEAEATVKKLRNLSNEIEIRQELTNIRLSLEAGSCQTCWTLCSSEDNVRSCMLIAAGLVISQQLSGQPNVLYYAPTIFHQVGFCGSNAATLATVSLGAVKLIATVASLIIIDRMGRRNVLLLGAGLMGISLFLLSIFAFVEQNSSSGLPAACHDVMTSNQTEIQPPEICGSTHLGLGLRSMALIALMMYVAAYSFGFGPVTWLILSEIFPTSIKGRAMAVSTSLNWASNLIISATFLQLIQTLSLGGVFTVYSLVSIAAVAFIFAAVPETRHKPLRQITKELKETTFKMRFIEHSKQIPCIRNSSWMRRAGTGRYTQLDDRNFEVIETAIA